MTATPELKHIPCGGCGNNGPKKRCIGCMHDFGTPDSAWVHGRAAQPAQRLYTEAELQSAIAAAMMGAVKPLEWREAAMGNHKKGEVFCASSLVYLAPIGIHKKHDGWWLNKDCKTYPTIEAAKAAAQADYTARILSALSIHTDAAAALEAVKAQANHDGYDRCKERAAQLIEALFIGEGAVQLAAQIRALEGSQLCE